MPHIRVNDSDYYYELHGQGKTLVLISGYACDHHFWDLILEFITPHFQVLVLDNRAVGQTRDNGLNFLPAQMADEIYEVIYKLNLEPLSIIGHSMGGIIAQCIARKYASICKKLILLNCGATINMRSLFALGSFIKLLEKGTALDDVLEISLPWFYSAKFIENSDRVSMLNRAIANNPYPQSLPDLKRHFFALKHCQDKVPTTEIPMATQIIYSQNDIICLPNESLALIKTIPQAKFSILESGHASPIEVPKEVANTMLTFLLDNKTSI